MTPFALGQVVEAQQFSLNGLDYQAQCAAGSRHSLNQISSYQRFEVRSGDVHILDTAEKERCEVYVRDGTVRAIPFDTDLWLSFAIRIPGFAEFPPASGSTWCDCAQIHSTASPNPGDVALSPPWTQNFAGGVLSVETRAFSSSPVTSNPGPVVRYSDASFPRDTWVNFVYKLNFDPSAGHMTIYRNGSSVYDSAIPLGYDQPDAGYLKYGVYRSAYSQTTVVEYANFECGTSDLSARVSTPLPNPY